MEPKVVGNRIKKIMEKRNITVEELSQKLKIEINELNDKLEGKEEFYIDEMKKIKEVFSLDENTCDKLFFKEECNI